MNLLEADKIVRNLNSWDDFVDSASNLTKKEKGDLFERFVQIYLSINPTYKNKLKNVWLGNELPLEIKDTLKAPDTDEGIDLYAETYDGKFWSIQAKYRTHNEALNVEQLSTFTRLSFVSCNNINFALIAHTTSKRIRKASLLENKDKDFSVAELGLSTWLNLTVDDWKAINQFAQNKIYKPVPREPRGHQEDALVDFQKHFIEKNNSRGTMIMPCASGKSLIGYWAAQRMNAKTIVLAIPSLALLKQSLEDWNREFSANNILPDWIAICSDKKTTTFDSDSFVMDELEGGVPLMNNIFEIESFLKKNTDKIKVIFTTYQSSFKLTQALQNSDANIDLCIFDEAHKTVGQKEKQMSVLLSVNHCKINKFLFMTATSRVLKGEESDEVLSMNNETVYGKYFHQLTFKKAIADGIICDYQIITLSISDKKIKKIIEENNFVRDKTIKEAEYEATQLAIGISIEKIIDQYNIKHVLSFHSSIKLAEDFCAQQEDLKRIGIINKKIKNFTVSSKQTTGDRTLALKKFKQAEYSLISNARCLTEGVDVPTIDCVLFANPRHSVVDIIQATGRALRPSEETGKKKGYILLPIIVPENIDFESFAETSAFRQIIKQLAALSTSDSRIAEEFSLIFSGKKFRGTRRVIIEGTIPSSLNIDFNQFSKLLNTKIWKAVGRVNFLTYEQAKELVNKNNIGSEKKYVNWIKEESIFNLPITPSIVYKGKGWVDWYTFLNSNWWSFEKAKDFVQKLNLKSKNEYIRWFKENKIVGLHSTPDKYYINKGWVSWFDFLGTQEQIFLPYTEARNFVRTLKLKTQNEYNKYSKSKNRPFNIPSNPQKIYLGKGWVGWPDYLGTAWMSYKECKNFIRSFKIRFSSDFKKWYKKNQPENIPANPQLVYIGKGWISWPHFLGTINLSYDEARDYLSKYNLKGSGEYKIWWKINKPLNLPSQPKIYYNMKGWKSWEDFLSINN